MLILGEIEYANVYPLFHQLKKESGLSFVPGVPSYVNRMLRDGAVDISACSSVEYARRPEHYFVVPGLSISSIGAVKSVNLFSDMPVEKLEGARVHLTAASETSVLLLKVLFARKYGITVRYTHVEDEADAWLKIGDDALFNYYNTDRAHTYDLGRLWYDFTGLPFVFALWLARRAVAEERRDEMTRFVNRLHDIKADSRQNLAALIDEYHMKGLTSLQVLDYWETMNYDLTEKHVQGLLTFYRMAVEIGELKRVPPLDFFV